MEPENTFIRVLKYLSLIHNARLCTESAGACPSPSGAGFNNLPTIVTRRFTKQVRRFVAYALGKIDMRTHVSVTHVPEDSIAKNNYLPSATARRTLQRAMHNVQYEQLSDISATIMGFEIRCVRAFPIEPTKMLPVFRLAKI